MWACGLHVTLDQALWRALHVQRAGPSTASNPVPSLHSACTRSGKQAVMVGCGGLVRGRQDNRGQPTLIALFSTCSVQFPESCHCMEVHGTDVCPVTQRGKSKPHDQDAQALHGMRGKRAGGWTADMTTDTRRDVRACRTLNFWQSCSKHLVTCRTILPTPTTSHMRQSPPPPHGGPVVYKRRPRRPPCKWLRQTTPDNYSDVQEQHGQESERQ